MARSLSLSAYLAYARHSAGTPYKPDKPRPDGTVVWAHAVEQSHFDAVLELHERLLAQRPDISMLLTTGFKADTRKSQTSEQIIIEPLPEDSVTGAEIFFAHWSPDFGLWTGGDLQPALLSRAEELGIPMGFVDAEEDLLARPVWRWFPDLPRSVLRAFEFIMARDDATVTYLKRMGVWDRNMSVTGPFLDGPLSLPYNESDREELAQLFLGRQVWLAAHVHADELPIILAAHRQIIRISHRAMLVVTPADLNDAPHFKSALDKIGLRYIEWSSGDFPEETIQVTLADTPDEMGLWYRLAPISFMGSSLISDGGGSDPNQPAAHGSAILYGPNIDRFLDTYSRFADAGAARIVQDADMLANAVKRLIPPDQTATMAHAAWDVASRSAELTDKIADKIHHRLDQLGAE